MIKMGPIYWNWGSELTNLLIYWIGLGSDLSILSIIWGSGGGQKRVGFIDFIDILGFPIGVLSILSIIWGSRRKKRPPER